MKLNSLKKISMRVISTKFHGVLDYLVGLILIASPWVFNFNTAGAEQWIPVILGVAALVYSLMTDYELGFFKVLPMKTHLNIDLASGILLALSPFIFGFSNRVITPHVVLGVLEIGAALMTKNVAYSNNKIVRPAV